MFSADDSTLWRHAFETLVDELPEAAFVVDSGGTITRWNDAVSELLGVPATQAVGMNAYDLFGTDDQSETLAEEVIRTGEPVREESFRSAEDASGQTVHARAIAVPITSPDGSVVGAVELLLDVTDVVDQREQLHELQTEFSDRVDESVVELRESAGNVADRSQEISGLADEQADDLGAVQAEVSQFSATIEEIASSAEEVSSRSSEATDLAVESAETATEMTGRVESVVDESESAAADVSRLSERIDEIEEFVAVIDDIADQTNMLALNANIEAARSEGNNDGFAVVADEIKELADESKEHADQVEATVQEVHEMATDSAESVQRTRDAIGELQSALEDIIDNQQSIRTAIEDTDEGVTEIASATDDQAASAEEIASMVDEIADRADEVAGTVEEIAAANEQQHGRIRDLESDVDSVETQLQTVMENGSGQ